MTRDRRPYINAKGVYNLRLLTVEWSTPSPFSRMGT